MYVVYNVHKMFYFCIIKDYSGVRDGLRSLAELSGSGVRSEIGILLYASTDIKHSQINLTHGCQIFATVSSVKFSKKMIGSKKWYAVKIGRQ